MPKFYCEYCGIYLTHSSPSGRKQHAKGRKHIQNKIEYYSEVVMEQQGAFKAGGAGAGINAGINPFMKAPVMPGLANLNLPFNMPKPGTTAGLNLPSINIPGILPTNITNLPMANLPKPGTLPTNPMGLPGLQPGGIGGMGMPNFPMNFPMFPNMQKPNEDQQQHQQQQQ